MSWLCFWVSVLTQLSFSLFQFHLFFYYLILWCQINNKVAWQYYIHSTCTADVILLFFRLYFPGLPWFPARIGTEPILYLGMCPWLLLPIWDNNRIIRKNRCKTCPFNHSSGLNLGDCMRLTNKMQDGLHCLSKYMPMDITGKYIFTESKVYGVSALAPKYLCLWGDWNSSETTRVDKNTNAPVGKCPPTTFKSPNYLMSAAWLMAIVH